MSVQPVIFEPIYKHRIWGGEAIFRAFDRPVTAQPPIGESWELADLEDDQTVVAAGPFGGRTLSELVREWGRDLLGHAELFDGHFPLLIKFLDAQTPLSVQVHPDDQMANRIGGRVRIKDECWYVLDCVPGAFIYHGLQPGVSPEAFKAAMLEGRPDDVLRKVPVQRGVLYDLPSGTVHALGAGILIAEVQTPSDVTYRLYDWGRSDPQTGRPRELHLDEGLQCIDFEAPAVPPVQERSHVATVATAVTRLLAGPSFTIEKVRMGQGTRQQIPYQEPVVWIVLNGTGQVNWKGAGEPLAFRPGNVVLFPAAIDDGQVQIAEDAAWLEVTLPVKPDAAELDFSGLEVPARPDPRLVQISPPRSKPQ